MLYKKQSLYRVSAKKEHNRRGGRGVDIIKEEQAELLRLQAEILEQYFAGDIKLEHIRWFNDLTLPERDKLVAKSESVSQSSAQVVRVYKFALSEDLGIITVPDDYMHGICLNTFFEKNRKKLYNFSRNITDANFSNPSRILKPGDKLRVRAFCQIVHGSTTSKERMDFLKKQKGNVYLGAQGVALVFEQKRDQLPKGKWYASFDEADHLWKNSDGGHCVPGVFARSDGDFHVRIGCLEQDCDSADAFLSFSDSV